MAEIKSFPNNQDVYIGAEWVMKWLHGRTSGVFGTENNLSISVVPDSMSVEVSDGVGWLSNDKGDGIVFWNDSEQSSGSKLRLTHDVADGALDRIDRIVVTWETTNYVALPTISILKGTASSNPVAPALTNNNIQRQISLSRVNVPAGTVSLSSSMITDERLDPEVCGIVTETIKIDTSTMQNQFESLLKAIQNELIELESGVGVELKKLQFNNISISASEFVEDATYEDYPFRAAVALDGMIASMIPEVIFALPDAVSGNFAPVAESYNGGVYLYAAEIPEADVTVPTIVCWRGDSIGVGTTNAGGSGGGQPMELVWKNASPSSAFAPDTISLDSVENEIFMIQAASGANCVYVFGLPDGLTNQLQRLHGLSGSNMTAQIRGVTITHSEGKTLIAIARGQRKQVNSTSEGVEDNTVLVPRSIYRFKGVAV